MDFTAQAWTPCKYYAFLTATWKVVGITTCSIVSLVEPNEVVQVLRFYYTRNPGRLLVGRIRQMSLGISAVKDDGYDKAI